MSKIKVNEIESKSTDVVLTSNGTGKVKVKGVGGADGTLKLTSSNGTNGVKLKSPAHSATQSYTLTLPDNNIEANKLLKVKSITGSGNNAVGQLEYASVAGVDVNNLNGTDFTSGTVPSARTPSGFPFATTGAGLAHISTLTATNHTSLDFTGLDNDTTYLIICEKTYMSNTGAVPSFTRLDTNGTPDYSSSWRGSRWYDTSYLTNTMGTFNYWPGTGGRKHGFIMQFNTSPQTGYAFLSGMVVGTHSKGTMYLRYTNSNYLAGLRITASSGYLGSTGSIYDRNTFSLFKYLET